MYNNEYSYFFCFITRLSYKKIQVTFTDRSGDVQKIVFLQATNINAMQTKRTGTRKISKLSVILNTEAI